MARAVLLKRNGLKSLMFEDSRPPAPFGEPRIGSPRLALPQLAPRGITHDLGWRGCPSGLGRSCRTTPGVGNARREWARVLVSGIGHSPEAALPDRPD